MLVVPLCRILFVKPLKGDSLTPDVVERIRSSIRHALSTRHVPAKLVFCPKIPYTTNGKRLEIPVKKLVNGIPIDKLNLSSAEDPECLKFFVGHPELKVEETGKAKL